MTPSSRSLECIGGPYDGKRIDEVGPEYRVPLFSMRLYRAEHASLTLKDCERQGRVGIYRKLYSVQDGHPAYVWEPTPEVRSLYP